MKFGKEHKICREINGIDKDCLEISGGFEK